jgi:hypothetical protein
MSGTSTPNPSAGWYTDPTNKLQERYWDGAQWTTQERPLPPPTTQAMQDAHPVAPVPKVQEMYWTPGRILVGIVMGIIVFWVTVSLLNGGSIWIHL